MKKNEDVLVILVNYNGMSDTVECIESLEKSTQKVDILVVDNASGNDEYIKIQNKFKNIKVIANDVNVGFSGGNNIGIKYAMNKKYKYVLILNNDTIVMPDMIEKLLKNCDKNTITVPLIYYYNKPQKLWYGGGTINQYTGNSKMYDFINKKSHIQTFASGCCMLVDTSVFKKVGLLNEEYFMYCEDTEFCIRLAKNNIKIFLKYDAHMFHKVSQSTKKIGDKFSNYYNTRNRLKYIADNKKYFKFTAHFYTVITRYVRMVQLLLKGDNYWNIYLKAIQDFKKKRFGKSKIL